MAGNSALQLVNERGWRRGVGNLLRAGFARWWETRTGWMNALIWTVLINFILGSVLWTASDSPGLPEGITLLGIFMGLFPAVAVVIIMQGAVVGEKQSGTAEWVLSKPASRASFIISKLVPNALGVLVTMVICPGAVAYLQLTLANQGSLSLPHYALGLLLLWLHLLFFLSLTLMLGTLFDRWGAVIAIPLAFLFGQQYIAGLIPALAKVLPWALAVQFPGSEQSLVGMIMQGQQPPSYAPLYFVIICIVIFIAVAFWAFDRQEF